MGILVQVIATVMLCFSSMNMGISMGWPSSTILLFKSENTTLHRPMTDMDVTLFTSLPVIGAFVGQPLLVVGVLSKIGLKYTTILASMLFVVAWSIVAVTNRVEAILSAVVIIGAGHSILVLVSMYISEISQDSIRGTLTSGPNLSISAGLLVSYLLGGILDYHAMVKVALSLAVIGVVMAIVLKDSPVKLMAKGREEEAIKSLVFYRQTSSTAKELLTEINNIRRSLNIEYKGEYGQSLMEVEKQILPIKNNKMTFWQLVKSTPSIRRQLYLTLMLQTAMFYQGLPCILIYAELVFNVTVGDVFSPNKCIVILGVVALLSSAGTAYLTDKIGRRSLQLYSSLVSGICCLFLGTQITTGWLPKLSIPLVIYIFAAFFNLGSGHIPSVVAAEIFLPEVKSKLMMLTFQWSYICSFSAMFLFGIVIQSVGIAPIFYFFSFVCFITTVYFFFFLPETKGLPVYAIQALFTKERDSIKF